MQGSPPARSGPAQEIAQEWQEAPLDRRAVRRVRPERGHKDSMGAAEVVIGQRGNPMVQRVIAQADWRGEGMARIGEPRE